MQKLDNCYEQIISPENLWRAWELFRGGKRHRQDVRMFERNLEKNLLSIQFDLQTERYRPQIYRTFEVFDPKRRTISAPGVHDQVVHQAIWNILFPFFDRRFSSAVYSSRPNRGTHAAVLALARRGREMSTVARTYVLHIDIVKFFDSVAHHVLRDQLARWIGCVRTLGLLDRIIDSYASGRCHVEDDSSICRGIPLGNLTSQLFCNVMLMSFDQSIHASKWRQQYVRYADDSFILGTSIEELQECSRKCGRQLCSLGFEYRARICRFSGFEGLGARFFADGVGLRRESRVRSTTKLRVRIKAYQTQEIGIQAFESSVQSFRGLLVRLDHRWTTRVRREILGALYESSTI